MFRYIIEEVIGVFFLLKSLFLSKWKDIKLANACLDPWLIGAYIPSNELLAFVN